MIAARARWRIAGDVAYERVGDEVIALNLSTGAYFRLNRTAAQAWLALPSEASAPAICHRVLRRFEVEPGPLSRDIAGLLEQLERHGLIVRAR